MKRLILCEKASVALAVGIGLGVPVKGRLPYDSDDWVIAAARGHLLENAPPAKYDPRYETWRAEDLPILPERFEWVPRTEKGAGEALEQLVELLRDPEVEEVVNACDAGREGELIFKLIYHWAGVTKPVRRAWFSSLTPGAVRRAFEALRDDAEMKGLEDAAFARETGDWLIGINASRAASLRAKAERFAPVTMGRVQTPTLRILVEREREVDDYDPAPYYRVQAVLAGGELPAAVLDEEGGIRAFAAEPDAQAVATGLSGADAALASYTVEEVERAAPLPFDLATLQVDASRAFGWSASRTLRRAQELYEKQWISYPRTDSRFLTWDLKGQVQNALRSVGDALPELFGHASELEKLAEAGELPGRPFNAALVRDHHAIIPTGKKGADTLEGDQQRLYEMVARRFVAAFLPPLREEHHEARFEAAGHVLGVRGRRTLEAGWREVEGRDFGPEHDPLPVLERFRGAEPGSSAGEVHTAEVEERNHRRPRAHTDGTLIRAMERAGEAELAGGPDADEDDAADQSADDDGAPHVGVGTPATRSGIIERLIRSRYAQRDRTAIYATLRGRRLIGALDDLAVASPLLTSAWEARLAAIRDGREDRGAFEADLRELTRETVEAIGERPLEGLDAPPEEIGECPRCDGRILERDKVYGCSSWRSYEEPGCGWAVFRNTPRGRVGRREALWRMEHDLPHATGTKPKLAPAADADAPPLPGMEDYQEASVGDEPLPQGDDEEAQAAWETAIEEVVDAEGPVMVSRILAALGPRIRKGGQSPKKAKKPVNKRSAALVKDGVLLEVEDGRTPKGQQDRVVRLPDQPEVLLRTRGPRDVLEIPWREIRAAAEALDDGADSAEEVAEAFQIPVDKLEGEYREWIEGALARAGAGLPRE
jgi:DNA topoisomerase III